MNDSASIRVIPPVYMVVLLVIGFGLEWLLPCGVATSMVWKQGGSLILVMAFMLYLWTVWTMIQSDTPLDVRKPAKTLLVHGPFRYSRNPMYLAAVLLFVGWGFVINSVWLCLGGIVLQQILSRRVIAAEESYLKQQFAETYDEYAQQVRRWL